MQIAIMGFGTIGSGVAELLLKNNKSTIRLVIQDIAGEDTENRTKYSKAVRKADMLLFFVDPWHVE
ncbi:MAG: hypothetical protein II621_03555, partial [Clostridia bacterium]|nr:hypothetical protein [Clostridia bacterium]